jgi:hypothetical protein
MIGLCQVLSAFTKNFPKVPWPEELKQLMDTLSIVNLDLLNAQGIACITDTQFVDNFMVMLAAPWIVVAGLFILYHVSNRFVINNQIVALLQEKAIHYKLVLSMLFLIYPSISNTMLQMLNCKTLADGHSYLVSDYSVQCDSDEIIGGKMGLAAPFRVFRGFAVLGVIMYPVGIPAVFGLVLYYNRKRLYNPDGEIDPQSGLPCEPDEHSEQMLGMLYCN